MKFDTCAFTGHRQINKAHEHLLPELVFRGIEYVYSNGCRRFLSGGAIGFDTVAAKEVIKFRISHPDVSLIMVLPCINQDERWSRGQKAMYAYLLENADEVVYVGEEYTATCMKERNAYLAEKADVILSYVERANSGSAQTLRMAKAKNAKIFNLYSALNENTNIP